VIADAVVDAVVDASASRRRSHASIVRRGCIRSHPVRCSVRRPRMHVVVAPTCVDRRRAMPTGSRNFAQSGLCGAEKRPLDEKNYGCRSRPLRCIPGCSWCPRRQWRRRADVSRVKHETAEKKMF
jgi:hypothetical protein